MFVFSEESKLSDIIPFRVVKQTNLQGTNIESYGDKMFFWAVMYSIEIYIVYSF